MEKIYGDVGSFEEGRGGRLLTGVTSFGSACQCDHLRKPTDNYPLIAKAIDDIRPDRDGVENFCTAVIQSIDAYIRGIHSESRRLVVVLVTDESGNPADIEANLEAAIRRAKKCECPVYVIGYEAMFGARERTIQVTNPDTKEISWGPVDSGPETVEVEQLQQNPFGNPYKNYWSGYGPHAQVRLARETGGKFILLSDRAEKTPTKRDEREYAQRKMRGYAPDWCSRQEYLEAVRASKFRFSLMAEIEKLDPQRNKLAEKFRLNLSFGGPQQLREMSKEIQDASRWNNVIDTTLSELETLQTRRADETSKRWQANYDLLYAQLLLQRVLVNEYVACLSKVGDSMLNQPASGDWKNWVVGRRNEPTTVSRELCDPARRALQRVISEHPDTPWSLRAEHELRQGFGFVAKQIKPGQTKPSPVYKEIPL
jgi:hypothetical protein